MCIRWDLVSWQYSRMSFSAHCTSPMYARHDKMWYRDSKLHFGLFHCYNYALWAKREIRNSLHSYELQNHLNLKDSILMVNGSKWWVRSSVWDVWIIGGVSNYYWPVPTTHHVDPISIGGGCFPGQMTVHTAPTGMGQIVVPTIIPLPLILDKMGQLSQLFTLCLIHKHLSSHD